MRLTVLGCITPFPRPSQPCSGYLLSDSNVHVILDFGSGIFTALQRHLQPEKISAIWISHLHPDHSADLLALSSWALNTANVPRLAVLGPPGWANRLNVMLSGDVGKGLVSQIFEIHELYDNHSFQIGDLCLTSRSVQHSVPAFGLRVDCGKSVFAYSGDSGPCEALVNLAVKADVFLCEVGAVDSMTGHCTIQDVCRIAEKAAVKTLLLTHIAPGINPDTINQSSFGNIPMAILRANTTWPIGNGK